MAPLSSSFSIEWPTTTSAIASRRTWSQYASRGATRPAAPLPERSTSGSGSVELTNGLLAGLPPAQVTHHLAAHHLGGPPLQLVDPLLLLADLGAQPPDHGVPALEVLRRPLPGAPEGLLEHRRLRGRALLQRPAQVQQVELGQEVRVVVHRVVHVV